MKRESIKKRVKDAENRLEMGDNAIRVGWRHDGLCEWILPDGTMELISEAEFKARGGILLSWDDIERDQ